MSSDGIDEAFEGQFRTITTAAARMVEQIARARQQRAEDLARLAQSQAAEDRRRMAAEREVARAAIAKTRQDEWWSGVSRDEVARTVGMAEAWAERDPAFQTEVERLHAEVNRRYEIDEPDSRPQRPGSERARASEESTLSQLLDEEHRADVAEDLHDGRIDDGPHEEATAEASQSLYDSAERRRDRADQMAEDGVEEAVAEVALRADVAEGRPATEAVGGTARRSKARKNHGPVLTRGGERQR